MKQTPTKAFQKEFANKILDLLNGLQEEFPGQDHLITDLLMVALANHLHACSDYRMTDRCFNFLQSSLTDLYRTLMRSTVMDGASSALH
jgi:hypothetical protein